MKTRIALPLLYALGFLFVSAGTGSAQKTSGSADLNFSLDSATFTYDLISPDFPNDTLRGFLQNLDPVAVSFKINIQTQTHWTVIPRIGSTKVRDGDTMTMSAFQTLPVQIVLWPNPYTISIENYCLSLTNLDGSKALTSEHCIALIQIFTNFMGVSTDPSAPNLSLAPNPAGDYIFARGLKYLQAGYRYKIFSVNGEEVGSGPVPDDARINIEGLNSGTYRLLLFDEKHLLTNSAFTVLH